MITRVRLGLLALVVASSLLGSGSPVAAATKPAGGLLKFWATPTSAGASDLVITGAIGDYGSSVSIDQNGKADPNGNFSRVSLQAGTFRIDRTAFNQVANKASFPIDKSNCSSEGSISASAGVSQGTGLYKGIAGNLKITLTLVWIVGRNDHNKCDGTKKVRFHSAYLAGTGTVSFS